MINITELVQTNEYKNFMAKLYAWGASVVLTGAMFKIQHWPGASVMLVVGMSTEVIIFFFSAFEPLHEEVDWSLVYPELAHIDEGDETPLHKEKRHERSESATTSEFKGLKKLEVMLESVDVNADLFETLGDGLNKLNQTTANLSDVTETTIATTTFADNVKNATHSVLELSDSYNKSKEALHQAINSLTASYQNSADIIAQSGKEVADNMTQSGQNLLINYQQFADAIKASSEAVAGEANEYSAKIDIINKNLAALNTAYELQIKETNGHLANSKQIFSGFANMMNNLKDAAEETQKYSNEVSKLSENVAELNSIYGNMLSSLNLITK